MSAAPRHVYRMVITANVAFDVVSWDRRHAERCAEAAVRLWHRMGGIPMPKNPMNLTVTPHEDDQAEVVESYSYPVEEVNT